MLTGPFDELRRNALNLCTDEFFDIEFVSCRLQPFDVFRRDTLYAHGNKVVHRRLQAESVDVANILGSDALDAHRHNIVYVGMHSLFPQSASIFWGDALRLHFDELIDGEIAETGGLHRVDVGTGRSGLRRGLRSGLWMCRGRLSG